VAYIFLLEQTLIFNPKGKIMKNLFDLGNAVQVFENREFGKIRTIVRDGEPWFVAKDVCEVLGHSNVSMAVGRLDKDERMTLNFSEGHSGQRGGAQSWNIINEPGLYSLVLRSNKPEAKAFKRWVTHEVLPSIRKHGIYATPEAIMEMLSTPDAMIQIFQALKSERDQRIQAEEKIEQDKPKVLLAELAHFRLKLLQTVFRRWYPSAPRKVAPR